MPEANGISIAKFCTVQMVFLCVNGLMHLLVSAICDIMTCFYHPKAYYGPTLTYSWRLYIQRSPIARLHTPVAVRLKNMFSSVRDTSTTTQVSSVPRHLLGGPLFRNLS